MLIAFLSPSPMELVFIAMLALIVLGPKRLPEVARSVGRGMREMRESFQGLSDEDDEDEGDDEDDRDWQALEDEADEDRDEDRSPDGDAQAEGVGAPDRG